MGVNIFVLYAHKSDRFKTPMSINDRKLDYSKHYLFCHYDLKTSGLDSATFRLYKFQSNTGLSGKKKYSGKDTE